MATSLPSEAIGGFIGTGVVEQDGPISVFFSSLPELDIRYPVVGEVQEGKPGPGNTDRDTIEEVMSKNRIELILSPELEGKPDELLNSSEPKYLSDPIDHPPIAATESLACVPIQDSVSKGQPRYDIVINDMVDGETWIIKWLRDERDSSLKFRE